jgi:hypothetical protein
MIVSRVVRLLYLIFIRLLGFLTAAQSGIVVQGRRDPRPARRGRLSPRYQPETEAGLGRPSRVRRPDPTRTPSYAVTAMVTRPRSCGGAHRRLVAKVLQRAEGVNRSAPSHTAARAELG